MKQDSKVTFKNKYSSVSFSYSPKLIIVKDINVAFHFLDWNFNSLCFYFVLHKYKRETHHLQNLHIMINCILIYLVILMQLLVASTCGKLIEDDDDTIVFNSLGRMRLKGRSHRVISLCSSVRAEISLFVVVCNVWK
jgi:hypothetical protein